MRLAAIAAYPVLLKRGKLELQLASAGLEGSQRAALQWLLSTALREALLLQDIASRLLRRPWKGADADLSALLVLALCELRHGQRPAHAVVNDWVESCRTLGKPWASPVVNGVLRRYLREREALEGALQDSGRGHPAWLFRRLQAAYPERWEEIVCANLAEPPLWLRVSPHVEVSVYSGLLEARGIASGTHPFLPHALRLGKSLPVRNLPGWEEGWVTVQDGAAQLAAEILAPGKGERILDACAAPGGKTAHLLALGAGHVVALDRSPGRLQRVRESLARLGLEAECHATDAVPAGSWWDGLPFDGILLDAPCTATGVIRRHPDILLRRRESDLLAATAEQQRLLEGLWPLLRPGGRLLYCTCSVLPEENGLQIDAFLDRHPDARVVEDPRCGQRLPGEAGMDGFFYALLEKLAPPHRGFT